MNGGAFTWELHTRHLDPLFEGNYSCHELYIVSIFRAGMLICELCLDLCQLYIPHKPPAQHTAGVGPTLS